MTAGGEDRQAERHRSADVKQRETIHGGVQLIQSVDLRKAPGGVDLVAMRQPHQLRPAGGSAGMEEGAYRGAIGRWREVQRIARARNRRVEG